MSVGSDETDRRSTYHFGRFSLDLDRSELRSDTGNVIALRPKSFGLLSMLVRNAGRVLTRDVIMQELWPNVFVTDDSIAQCVLEIRRAVGSDGKRLVRSVPRRGYIFDSLVVPDSPSAPENRKRRSSSASQRPSVAVLPFTNMSGDPAQEYFSDGVAEDIATELSRSRSMLVIARQSSFAFKGTVDLQHVALELQVRYLLTGSLRRSGNRVRLTAQLIDTEEGTQAWAERYDRDVEDVFAVQDEIARAAALAIEPVIAREELRRVMRRLPGNLDTWEAYQLGLWHQAQFNVPDNIKARRFFEQAARLDPTFSPAWQGLAHTYLDENRLYFTHNVAESVAAAEPLARKAVALDPDDAGACAARGWVFLTQGDLQAALRDACQALELRPNSADAHRLQGTAQVFSGLAESGLRALEMHFRLNPHDPRNWQATHMTAMARYLMGDYAGSIEVARHAIRINSRQPLSYRWGAAALGQLGRASEAQVLLRGASGVVTPLSLNEYILRRWPWQRQVDHDHMLEGLLKAGWRPPKPPLPGLAAEQVSDLSRNENRRPTRNRRR